MAPMNARRMLGYVLGMTLMLDESLFVELQLIMYRYA